MRDISKADLRLVDAPLLMVFLGIMRHRQATAVANEMGLTQPAISHALKRLRSIYGDPLFLRRAHGLEPTALATKLEPKIQRIVELLSETLDEQSLFNPSIATTCFRIGAFDFDLTTALPNFVADLRETAPNVTIQALPFDYRAALEALAAGRIDIAIGFFDVVLQSQSQFSFEKLYAEEHVIVGRRGNPLLTKPMSLEAFAAANHLKLSPFGSKPTRIDHALLMHNLKREVKITLPSLLSALTVLGNSDLVAALPLRPIQAHADRFGLAFQELPFEEPSLTLYAARNRREVNSQAHRWLLERLRRAVSERNQAAAEICDDVV